LKHRGPRADPCGTP